MWHTHNILSYSMVYYNVFIGSDDKKNEILLLQRGSLIFTRSLLM